jgi:hypothetical protein
VHHAHGEDSHGRARRRGVHSGLTSAKFPTLSWMNNGSPLEDTQGPDVAAPAHTAKGEKASGASTPLAGPHVFRGTTTKFVACAHPDAPSITAVHTLYPGTCTTSILK